MDPKWFPPPNRPIQAAGFVLVPFVLTCNASLLLPPGRPRALLTLPPLLYLLCQVRRTTSGVNAEDYMSAINIALLSSRYVTSVLVANPETDMHRVFVTGEKKWTREPEDPQSMGWWSKLKWSMSFWFSGRGIGWDWQVKNVDDVPANLHSKELVRIRRLSLRPKLIPSKILHQSSAPRHPALLHCDRSDPPLYEFNGQRSKIRHSVLAFRQLVTTDRCRMAQRISILLRHGLWPSHLQSRCSQPRTDRAGSLALLVRFLYESIHHEEPVG